MIRGIFSLYWWRYPSALVYMLQSTEYQSAPYLKWYRHTTDFSKVAHRRQLDRTKAARLLLLALNVCMAFEVLAGVALIVLWHYGHLTGGLAFGIALILAYPIVWAHLAVVPLALGRWLIVNPRQRRLIKKSEAIFRAHPGAKIAIAGSYGKTSMKELLLTVLGEGKKVAATPANKNVSISHAYFAQKLQGDEDVVLIEYGEGAPGDIARFARITHPTHGVVTGVAPAHLDRYKTTERAAKDIFSLAAFVPAEQLYANAESPYVDGLLNQNAAYQGYDRHGALGWKVHDVQVDFDGTHFSLTKAGKTMPLHSRLMGRHQIGPLAFAAALADSFGMTKKQITEAIAKTQPFEHRMQPYQLGGAWVIDDTYNGNIEGIRAGTALLKELPGRRKIYVTPGLVDQGRESKPVHEEMGALIAAAQPDIVVLMHNSATQHIVHGLKNAGYGKEIFIEDDALGFYVNLSAFVAAGDVVVMQNDWTDNYR